MAKFSVLAEHYLSKGNTHMTSVAFPPRPTHVFYGMAEPAAKPLVMGNTAGRITAEHPVEEKSLRALLARYPGAEALSETDIAQAQAIAEQKMEKYAEHYKTSRPNADLGFHVFCEALDSRHQQGVFVPKSELTHQDAFIQHWGAAIYRTNTNKLLEYILTTPTAPNYEELTSFLGENVTHQETVALVEKSCKQLKTPLVAGFNANINRLKQQVLLMYDAFAAKQTSAINTIV
jgi:hypothetical protein